MRASHLKTNVATNMVVKANIGAREAKYRSAEEYAKTAIEALDISDNRGAMEGRTAATEKAETPAQLKAIIERIRGLCMVSDDIAAIYDVGRNLFSTADDKHEIGIRRQTGKLESAG